MYLVFDIETVVDWDLVYECEHNFAEGREECLERFKAEHRKKQSTDRPFIPTRYHQPVSAVFIAASYGAQYLGHKVISSPSPPRFADEFWSVVRNAPDDFAEDVTLCSFNGKDFDILAMEVAAHRYGVKLPSWLTLFPRYASDDKRSRYNNRAHLDLFAVFTSFQARMGGGLSFWSTVTGLPGKVCMDGGAVEEVLAKPDGLRQVNDYCMTDVLNTYGLLIHVLRSAGEIDKDLPLTPFTYQMDHAIKQITADPQWLESGCVAQWVQAYRAAESTGNAANTVAEDDDIPF